MALTKVWPFGGQNYAKSTATTSPPGGADRQLNTHYADRDGQKTKPRQPTKLNRDLARPKTHMENTISQDRKAIAQRAAADRWS